MSGAFDPLALIDDETGQGMFGEQPVHEVLTSLIDGTLTGRLSVAVEGGNNCLYFREGQPVGVELVEVFSPLGQLMLELGHLDGASFVRLQQKIDTHGRLPGQVYIEEGHIDATQLRDVLRVQATRKARRFVENCSEVFQFSRGLSFLTGFSATPLSADLLVLLALGLHFSEEERESYLSGFVNSQLRAPDAGTLPLEELGYGRAEERFVSRLNDWQNVAELDRFGTLPRPLMALLIKFLELRHLLQQRPAPADLPLVQTPQEADVFATGTEAPGQAAAALAQAHARKPRKEKTERISLAVADWKEPRQVRVEKTEVGALPSVMVDYGALGEARRAAAAKAKAKSKASAEAESDEPEDPTQPAARRSEIKAPPGQAKVKGTTKAKR